METPLALPHEVWERTPPQAQAYIRALEARVETLTSHVKPPCGVKRLRLCFPKAIRSRKLRRDSRFHCLYGYAFVAMLCAKTAYNARQDFALGEEAYTHGDYKSAITHYERTIKLPAMVGAGVGGLVLDVPRWRRYQANVDLGSIRRVALYGPTSYSSF